MRRPSTLAGLALALALTAGCSQPGSVVIRSRTAALTADNGISLNGISLNGISLNGVSLNGVSLNGVSLNGVSLNGVSLNGVSLNGSELVGTSGYKTYDGSRMVGALLSGTLSSSDTLPLRVDGARYSWGSGIWYYTVSYQNDSGWQPLCGGAEAIAFEGRWDYRSGVSGGGSWIDDSSAFTFACSGANIAKCAEIGYKPWGKTWYGASLRNHHLACIRMMRADYCGDGTSYTVDGTAINVYDAVGIQYDTEWWDKEAEWTADGARCVEYRSERQGYTPSCVYSLPDCYRTDKWEWGALLVSECHHCDRY